MGVVLRFPRGREDCGGRPARYALSGQYLCARHAGAIRICACCGDERPTTPYLTIRFDTHAGQLCDRCDAAWSDPQRTEPLSSAPFFCAKRWHTFP
jgi:hypothetical protein